LCTCACVFCVCFVTAECMGIRQSLFGQSGGGWAASDLPMFVSASDPFQMKLQRERICGTDKF